MCQDSHCLQFCERNIKKSKKRPQFAHTCLRFKHKKNSGRFVGEEILKMKKIHNEHIYYHSYFCGNEAN